MVIVLVVGLSNLGPVIKSAVNTYGPEITKTDVRLGDVKVSLFSAEAQLKDFYLGNPKGFKSPQAMKVRSIKMDVNEKSITTDTIVVDRIEVVDFSLHQYGMSVRTVFPCRCFSVSSN